jgi:hypothetical protein
MPTREVERRVLAKGNEHDEPLISKISDRAYDPYIAVVLRVVRLYKPPPCPSASVQP